MLDLEDVLRDLAARGAGHAVAIVVAAPGGSASVGAKAIYDAEGKRVGGDAFFSDALERSVGSAARSAIEAGEPALVEASDDACGGRVSVYLEPGGRRAAMLVLGSGPVAEALVRIGAASGLAVSVAGKDATRERYPAAATLRELASFERLERPKANVHVVVTTGHEADTEALRAALVGSPASVQLVASTKRLPRVLSELRGAGIRESLLAQVRAPAGLDIGSEGPQEIALSIVAEVVRLIRGGSGRPLSEVKGGRAAEAPARARTVVLAPEKPPAPVHEAAVPALGGRKRPFAAKADESDETFAPLGPRIPEGDEFRASAPPNPDDSSEFRPLPPAPAPRDDAGEAPPMPRDRGAEEDFR
jgi:xanthine dehydrogenase accessory factor